MISLASDNKTDERLAKARLRGNIGLRSPRGYCGANLIRDFFGKLGLRMISTGCAWDFQPSLERRVGHVVLLGADKKVGWVKARRVVALVQNHKPFRNRTVGKFPDEPVNSNRSAAKSENPVPMISFRIWPFPAGIEVAEVRNMAEYSAYPSPAVSWRIGHFLAAHLFLRNKDYCTEGVA
jgi:hypothetical protein